MHICEYCGFADKVDIPNTIGITGTPTIDPTTDIVYFFSKTYIPNYRVAGNTGTSNGVYYFHAVNINTLADVFPPILIDGSVADNDPQKYFVGGVILQRPSLIQVGTVVYGAFGGHCDLFNYTGVIVGVDINEAKIVTQFAMESGPLAQQTNVLLQNGGGGEAGIWMSGMGIASDGDRIFVVTGNGDVSSCYCFIPYQWLLLTRLLSLDTANYYFRLTKIRELLLPVLLRWRRLEKQL
jgi:hypothetical protein